MAIDLGDTVPLAVTITDEAGQPTTPTAVVLTIQLPDGTVVTPTPSSVETGIYKHDYLPTMPGRHVVRWVSTVPGTAYSDIFDVRAPASTIISLADAKRHLRMPAASTADDEQLRSFCEVVTAVVEDVSGRTIVRRTVTEQHTTYGRDLALFVAPVVSLTSITDVAGIRTWNVADYSFDPESGWLSPLPGKAPLAGRVDITYEAGMASPPSRYVQAALVTLRHLWESQRVPVGGRQVGNAAAVDQLVTVSGWSIPHAAVDLIGPRAVEVG